MKRGGVSANFGADGDSWEDVGWDVDLMVSEGMEQGDVEGGEVV